MWVSQITQSSKREFVSRFSIRTKSFRVGTHIEVLVKHLNGVDMESCRMVANYQWLDDEETAAP